MQRPMLCMDNTAFLFWQCKLLCVVCLQRLFWFVLATHVYTCFGKVHAVFLLVYGVFDALSIFQGTIV